MSSATSTGPLTSLETITLEDAQKASSSAAGASARVAIAPTRGGMVTRFDVGDTPVLFLDLATLTDTAKNVRGGNPVLFPSPGPLAGDQFTCEGRSGVMKQHGFARQEPWDVVARHDRDVTLELRSNARTLAQFPWAFVARITYALAGSTLRIETTIENRDEAAMPFALGFHPYFYVPDAEKGRAKIATTAPRAFDNVTKRTVEIDGLIDLTQREVDLHLERHTPHSATLERARDRIVVAADERVRTWVIWTLAGKDFVCLEPWTAPAGALNTGDGLVVLAPGAAQTWAMSITLVS